MKAWDQRPEEVANLLNPVFCALLIRFFVDGYAKEGGKEVDPSLCFLALPLALHRDTRQALPGRTSTTLHSWVEQHQELRVGFSRRCRGLVPITKEAITYGSSASLIRVNESGSLCVGEAKLPGKRGKTEEIVACEKASFFVGRWFSLAGTPERIYSLCGVRP